MSDLETARSQNNHARVPRKGKPVKHLKRKRRWRRRLIITAVVLLIMSVLLAGGAFGYIAYRSSQVHHIHVNGLTQTQSGQPENILLVGNNSRCALNGQQSVQFGSCAQVGGARSDVTMVIHLNPATHQAFLLSIPRDLFVPIANFSSTAAGRLDHAKIDASLNVSPDYLVQTVEQDLGIPINHFVELNFDTFQSVVQDLGGVHMYFPTEVKDSMAGLGVYSTGCVYLDGTQALALVRARHLYYLQNGVWQYDGLGDISRIRRDHEFLKVLGSAVRSQITNPLTANSIVGSVLPDLQVDQNFSFSEMASLAWAFHNVSVSSMPSATVPTVGEASYTYNGADFGDVVFPVQPADQQLIGQFLGTSGLPGSNISPGSFTLEVLNGTNTYNLGTTTSQALTNDGFNVTGVGNTQVVSSQQVETSIYYTPGHLAQAQRLMDSLSGTVIMGQKDLGNGADVTLVVGTQLGVNPPSAPSPTTPASTQGQTTTAPSTTGATTTTTSPFGPINPSQVFQSQVPLPWFDPRSCTDSSAAPPS